MEFSEEIFSALQRISAGTAQSLILMARRIYADNVPMQKPRFEVERARELFSMSTGRASPLGLAGLD